MFRVIFSDGYSVAGEFPGSIVDGLSSLGLSFPHSCSLGRCEACKVRLISGSTEIIQPEVSLTRTELEGSMILACSRRPTSDLVLDCLPARLSRLPQSRSVPCKLAALEKVTHDLFRVTIQLPPCPQFIYLPGQHVDFIYPSGCSRKYSIAGGDPLNHRLLFFIRAHKGGKFEQFAMENALGALFKIKGPLGTFMLPEPGTVERLVFIATGTGISVFNAMLSEIDSWSPHLKPKQIDLLWGVSSEAELQLASLHQLDQSVIIRKTVSRPSRQWFGRVGRVSDILQCEGEELISGEGIQFYLCGNHNMVHDVRLMLLQAKICKQKIHSDAFVESKSEKSNQ